MFQKAYAFFNEVSNEIKGIVTEKSKVFDLKDKFFTTRLNQKITNESYLQKIDWIEPKTDLATRISTFFGILFYSNLKLYLIFLYF